MGQKQFFRQKWTKYLGELRPIHDINVNFVCSETPFYSQIIYKTGVPSDIYNSTDGINWFSAGTLSSSSDYFITDTITNGKVRLINSFYTASPNNNTIWYSEDGLNYSIVNVESPSLLSLPFIWDTQRFITGTIEGDLLISEDGITWEHNSTLNSLFPFKYNFGFNGTHYMVLGSGSTGVRVAYSTNLNTWNLSPSGATGQASSAMVTINGRTYLTGGYGNGGGYYYTDDGVNWSERIVVSGSGYIASTVWTMASNGLVLLAGAQITGTTGNRIFYSFDSGSTWNAASTPFSGSSNDSVRDIMFDGTKFLAFGATPNDGCYSYDGINWTAFSGVTYASNFARGIVYPQPYAYPKLTLCGNIPTRTPNISSTPTNTPTVTPTPSCPITTQYLEVQLSDNTKFKLILWNDAGYTSPATANCNYIISGCAYGDLGTVYCGQETITSGQHQHQFDLAPVLLPGEVVTGFTASDYTLSGCPCPVDLILPLPPGVSPSPTPTLTATPAGSPTQTPTTTLTLTPTASITATPSSTPPAICYCYWLFNETGGALNYSYTQCGGLFISDTLAGGAQIRICSEDLPAVDPGITSTPCGITCTLDSDCIGCT